MVGGWLASISLMGCWFFNFVDKCGVWVDNLQKLVDNFARCVEITYIYVDI